MAKKLSLDKCMDALAGPWPLTAKDWVAWDLALHAVSTEELFADNGVGLDAKLTELFGKQMQIAREGAFWQQLQ